MDGKREDYVLNGYDYKLNASVPKWQLNQNLDLCYEGLKSLGYEMSEEEVQLQNGSHPLFKVAAQLLKAYKEDVKRAQAKASAK